MSEERTHAPSRRRRQQAREAGRVAHSPELTAAAGLLAAVVLLGVLGGDLARGLIELVRAPLVAASMPLAPGDIHPGAVSSLMREAAWQVLLPLCALVAGASLAMLVMHHLQVGFLWVPSLLAPDPARFLQGWSTSADPLAAMGRASWSFLKSGVVLGVAGWSLGSNLGAFNRLAMLDPGALAEACGVIAGSLLRNLALALAVLGVIDFALRWRRQEAMLQMTPEEGRQDQREADGDPELRARRLRLARTWRNDPMELLPGSVLLLTGPPGLAVLLAGGPPPEKPITVRRVARGRDAIDLRRSAESIGLPVAQAPDLAAHLARGRSAAGSLPPDLATRLAAMWPAGLTGG